MTARYAVGSLVRARGRDWVVLPESVDDFLVLRPLAGGDDDTAGVLPEVESVDPATFPPPTLDDLGDECSARLLRDALRIGFRNSAGPFRSLASINVEPRPYQLVPLLLALRQQTVRLLIADDVGIGKTVEAGLIAAELLAQHNAAGLSVLCPPSLAEQWADELREKFGLPAELVLPATVGRLERSTMHGESIFERYRVTVVSTDFIKADRRRDEFLRAAPDLVIVDEAHGCVADDSGRGGRGRTQRYRLLQDLATDRERHLLLVTATPHSGNESAFRNLLGLLDPRLASADLATDDERSLLARHMVQRRRADIRGYLSVDTKFPSDRETREVAYKLSRPYRRLFDDAVAYARGQVLGQDGSSQVQRVRWWSALALLRSLASSPAAAAATLATRATAVSAADAESADQLGRASVLDLVEDEALDGSDTTPGALPVNADDPAADRRAMDILRDLRVQAEALTVDDDAKLGAVVKIVRVLVKDGFSPIVFCRFIPTAGYVGAHLRKELGKRAAVEVVTGELAPEDRAARVRELAETDAPARVLVATDCLSEGVNLQRDFQAVVHYDLAWNPTRHEQREGRVDRFGQVADVVRAVTLYGEDTGIDGIVLEILLRKHEQIRRDLGVSVPVPSDTNDRVIKALAEGLLLRGRPGEQLVLDVDGQREIDALDDAWRSAAKSEQASRSRFAQRTVRPDDVATELDAVGDALGRPDEIATFARLALDEIGAETATTPSGFALRVDTAPLSLRNALAPSGGSLEFCRDLPSPRGTALLTRTDPNVGAIARYTLDAALDPSVPDRDRPARRASYIRTSAVDAPTTLLLARIRMQVTLPGRHSVQQHAAEEARLLAFTGPPSTPTWLDEEDVAALLTARATANSPADVARNAMTHVLAALPTLEPHLERVAAERADVLREAHARVRRAARGTDTVGQLGVRGLVVEPQLPVDVLGVFVYLPAVSR